MFILKATSGSFNVYADVANSLTSSIVIIVSGKNHRDSKVNLNSVYCVRLIDVCLTGVTSLTIAYGYSNEPKQRWKT